MHLLQQKGFCGAVSGIIRCASHRQPSWRNTSASGAGAVGLGPVPLGRAGSVVVNVSPVLSTEGLTPTPACPLLASGYIYTPPLPSPALAALSPSRSWS